MIFIALYVIDRLVERARATYKHYAGCRSCVFSINQTRWFSYFKMLMAWSRPDDLTCRSWVARHETDLDGE